MGVAYSASCVEETERVVSQVSLDAGGVADAILFQHYNQVFNHIHVHL
jgi:hypothetical protein